MADLLWERRRSAAAAALCAAAALLALLDAVTRPDPGAEPLLFVLAGGLAAAAAACWFARIDDRPSAWRFVAPILVVAATAVAVLGADSASSTHAATGLVALTTLTSLTIGISLGPGSALLFAPVLVAVTVLANRQDPDGVSLAVPLLGVPVGALIGEVVSTLLVRADRPVVAPADHRRLERLNRLEEGLRDFRLPNDFRRACYEVASAANATFDTDRATVVLRHPSGELVSASVGVEIDDDELVTTGQLITSAVQGGEPAIVPVNGHGLLVMPLRREGSPGGAVVCGPVDTSDPEFTLDLARLFEGMIRIDQLTVIAELEAEVNRDALTGLGNRRHGDALLASLTPGDAIILLDLDGFKAVNDTYGHPEGDQVLQLLSAHLRSTLRDSDTSARLGGDEFLILARQSFADPSAVADRVLSGWRTKEDRTTLSAGVAVHDSGAASAETFERADRALYAAKAAGKNQAVVYEADLDDDGR